MKLAGKRVCPKNSKTVGHLSNATFLFSPESVSGGRCPSYRSNPIPIRRSTRMHWGMVQLMS
jgi:hypothetical protein